MPSQKLEEECIRISTNSFVGSVWSAPHAQISTASKENCMQKVFKEFRLGSHNYSSDKQFWETQSKSLGLPFTVAMTPKY